MLLFEGCTSVRFHMVVKVSELPNEAVSSCSTALSYGSEGFNKKIQWTYFNVKKRNSGEFLFVLYAIKRGVPVLLHQKKVYMRKGGMKYEQIQFIGCTLNWVEKISIFFPFRILMVWKTRKNQDF